MPTPRGASRPARSSGRRGAGRQRPDRPVRGAGSAHSASLTEAGRGKGRLRAGGPPSSGVLRVGGVGRLLGRENGGEHLAGHVVEPPADEPPGAERVAGHLQGGLGFPRGRGPRARRGAARRGAARGSWVAGGALRSASRNERPLQPVGLRAAAFTIALSSARSCGCTRSPRRGGRVVQERHQAVVEESLGAADLAAPVDEAKFAELLLPVAESLASDRSGGATKINKALFIAEFAHVRNTGRPITSLPEAPPRARPPSPPPDPGPPDRVGGRGAQGVGPRLRAAPAAAAASASAGALHRHGAPRSGRSGGSGTGPLSRCRQRPVASRRRVAPRRPR